MSMCLGVFQEFAHPEVLKLVEEKSICKVDIASKPSTLATTEDEKRVVRTNAKLIKMPHNISASSSPYDALTPETFAALEERTDEVLKALVELGFEVVYRNPVTSAGCPMVDRVILSYPE